MNSLPRQSKTASSTNAFENDKESDEVFNVFFFLKLNIFNKLELTAIVNYITPFTPPNA